MARAHFTDFERMIERLELCRTVVSEVHTRLEIPKDSEQKADILLAVEALAHEVVDLLKTTNRYVWGDETKEE